MPTDLRVTDRSRYGLPGILLAVLLSFANPVAAEAAADAGADPAAAADAISVSALSWMTGSWAGPAGPGVTLEENWAEPAGGSMASLVRMTTSDATPMVELIVIEESDGSLVLHLQQWDPGFAPRSDGPQQFTLTELGDRSVHFTSVSEGSLKSLAYSSPDPESFNIDVVTADGTAMTLQLKAVR